MLCVRVIVYADDGVLQVVLELCEWLVGVGVAALHGSGESSCVRCVYVCARGRWGGD